MSAFEAHTLRDKTYRKQFEQKLEELRAVRKQHTFISYATNRQLFAELQVIYDNNLKDYTLCYLDNVRAFEALKNQIQEPGSKIHQARQQELQQRLTQIGQQLEAEDYDINAGSKKLIETSAEQLETYRKEYANWEADLAAYRMQLKQVMNQVWSEQFEVYKRAYQQHKSEVMGTQLPTEAIQLAPAAVKPAIEERATETARLLKKAARTPRFLAAAEAFRDSYASYEAFQQLERDIDHALRNRSRVRTGIVAVVLALLLAGGYFGPGLYRTHNEDNAWVAAQTENTFIAYQQYLQTYPEGQYVQEAQNAQLLLDYGSIPDFTDINGESFAYEGDLEQALPEGKGTAIYVNGDRYEGEWQGGIRTGLGTLEKANGDVYEGMWKFGHPEGKGTQKFANGDDYSGDWKAGLFHGRGTLNFADGGFYDGQWVKGKQEGRGTFQSAEGLKYTGEWKGGMRNGEGTQDYANGSTYVGKWEADQRSGYGTLYFPDRSQFSGQWLADRIGGKGTYISKLREEFVGSWEGSPEEITLRDPTGRVVRQGKWEGGLFLSY